MQNQLRSGRSIIGVNIPADGGYACQWRNAGGSDLRLGLHVSNHGNNCGRKSPCQGFEDRFLSCSGGRDRLNLDGNNGVPRHLIRRPDRLGCKPMLRRRQRNTVMCSGYRNNCCGQESVFCSADNLVNAGAGASEVTTVWRYRNSIIIIIIIIIIN